MLFFRVWMNIYRLLFFCAAFLSMLSSQVLGAKYPISEMERLRG